MTQREVLSWHTIDGRQASVFRTLLRNTCIQEDAQHHRWDFGQLDGVAAECINVKEAGRDAGWWHFRWRGYNG